MQRRKDVYLHQALGDADAALAVTRETVGLSLSPSLILDIQVLAQAQRLARQPEMVPGLRAELERAVAVYGRPFLEDLSRQDAPEFEDWVAGQRAHWLSVVGELLDRLATLHVDEGISGPRPGRWSGGSPSIPARRGPGSV